MKKFLTAAAFVALMGTAASAAAANLITNGDFTQLSAGPGQISYNTTATGWSTFESPVTQGHAYNFVMANATTGANGEYGNVALWDQANGGGNGWNGNAALSGNFLAMDNPFQGGPVQQTLTGLVIGKTYAFSYYYAFGQQKGYDGATAQGLTTTIGGDFSQTVGSTNPAVQNVGDKGFTGWTLGGGSFVATSTTETLQFLAYGAPQVPPFALVSNVSLSGPVPEPATWALMIVGFGGLGVAARSRRKAAAQAA